MNIKITTNTELSARRSPAVYVSKNLKKCKNPSVRMGYEYNKLIDLYEDLRDLYQQQILKTEKLQEEIDRHEFFYELYYQQILKTDALQEEIDRLHNMMYVHNHVYNCKQLKP